MLKRIAKMLRTIPDSSKHFFEIFPNFIWESSQNIYYLDKSGLLRKRNSLTLKQSFSFQKNHDIYIKL